MLAYENDGVVRLRGLLAPALIEQLARGIDHALGGQWEDPNVQTYSATATADELKAAVDTPVTKRASGTPALC